MSSCHPSPERWVLASSQSKPENRELSQTIELGQGNYIKLFTGETVSEVLCPSWKYCNQHKALYSWEVRLQPSQVAFQQSLLHSLYTHFTLILQSLLHSHYTHFTLTLHSLTLTFNSHYTHYTLTLHSLYTHTTLITHTTLTLHLLHPFKLVILQVFILYYYVFIYNHPYYGPYQLIFICRFFEPTIFHFFYRSTCLMV